MTIFSTGIVDSQAKIVIDIVKSWVKTWFFDIESEEEYKVSKSRFYKWLQEQFEKEYIPLNMYQAIKTWIVTCLDQNDSHWLNYLRLNVCGMNQRTSSVCESLHASMKSSYDKVEASMSTTTSANVQMTKAQRRGNQQCKKNANQAKNNRTWTSTDTQNYLTDYGAEMAEVETILSQNFKVVQMGPNIFFVFMADSTPPGMFLTIENNYH